jgi:hypothetical protein
MALKKREKHEPIQKLTGNDLINLQKLMGVSIQTGYFTVHCMNVLYR